MDVPRPSDVAADISDEFLEGAVIEDPFVSCREGSLEVAHHIHRRSVTGDKFKEAQLTPTECNFDSRTAIAAPVA